MSWRVAGVAAGLIQRQGALALRTAHTTHTTSSLTTLWTASTAPTVAHVQRCNVHTSASCQTHVKKKDPHFELKVAATSGHKMSREESFVRDLGFSFNGAIGTRLKVTEAKPGSRLGTPVDNPIPPSKPNSQRTRTQFLVVDDDEVDSIVRAMSKYVYPETQGLDAAFESREAEVISVDKEAANPRFRFVFVDTSAGKEYHEREVRIRECDGTLRTATQAELEKYNQEFFARQYKKKNAPAICSPAVLPTLLASNRHNTVLDLVVKELHPYQQSYREVHEAVYADVLKRSAFNALQDSQHWPAFVRFLIREKKVLPLVNALQQATRVEDAANLVLLAENKPLDSFGSQKEAQSIVKEFQSSHSKSKQ
eukprot:m.358811 g.358811  ORF g.358811 m.358811 type:complete len:367 (-) comp18295_c0_seq1:107-1207(-)